MLFQIQKELINKRNNSLVNAIGQDFSKYSKLKKQYVMLTLSKKKHLINPLKIFLLLNAVNYDDITFAEQLVKTHDYENMNLSGATLALGRFYGKCGGVFKKNAIKHLLSLFEEDNISISDLGTLFNVLFENADHENCRKVIEYALTHYSDNLAWNIEILTYQIKMKHMYGNNENLIVENLKLLYPRCKTDGEYVRMANCFYEAGFFNDAINMFDISLQKISPIHKRYGRNNQFSSSECFDSMNEVVDILEAHNIQPFPIGGSLLGLIRDGKFMDYDKDADLGILIESYDEIFQIVSILCEKLKFTAPSMVNNSKESHMWNVGIFDTERVTAIDLFFFHSAGTHIEEGVYTNSGILKWHFSNFHLIRQKLAGKEYWIPNNVDLFLTELFGEWKQPVEVWDSLINCPNLMPCSRPVVLYYGLLRLYNALAEGKLIKALNYYQSLTEQWNMKFSQEAEQNIKKILNMKESIAE